jgi:hypothetical protein
MLPTHLAGSGPTVQRTINRREARGQHDLEAHSHRDDVRREIRDAIRAGTIRVVPCPGDPERVWIIPGAGE